MTEILSHYQFAPITTDSLLTDVNPQTISQFSLPAGNHVLTIEATDSTGLTRVEQISVYVAESPL